MDLAKIMKTPHTAEQIEGLWTAYHTAKSQSPGSGSTKVYLSGTMPSATYERLLASASTYPCFVLPLPRPGADDPIAAAAAGPPHGAPAPTPPPHEFYFLQWTMHRSPPPPSPDGVVLPPFFASNQPCPPQQPRSNPPCTTVLFTSLQEYKHRQDYATPHLVLTHYTDLAQSHGIVLLRGELTPSTSPSPSGQRGSNSSNSSSSSSTMLSPADAQRLALLLQQFYLPPLRADDARGATRAHLLRRFHEEPAAFRWEDVIDSIVV
jgi:ATP synthase F1 complex assembly factor 1